MDDVQMRVVDSKDLKGSRELAMEWADKRTVYLNALIDAHKETVRFLEHEIENLKTFKTDFNEEDYVQE